MRYPTNCEGQIEQKKLDHFSTLFGKGRLNKIGSTFSFKIFLIEDLYNTNSFWDKIILSYV
jgi:hypothetical protein